MLWKSILLALALIVVLGIALDRLIVHLVNVGGVSVETDGRAARASAGRRHRLAAVDRRQPRHYRRQRVSDAGGHRRLSPAFSPTASARRSSARNIPADPPGKALPLWLAMWEGGKTALLAVLIYLCAAPLLLFAGFGAVIFFLATAYILRREYFELAAMRFRPPAEAKALRKRNAMTVYIAGLFIAAFVSIPIVNLATPLFAMALDGASAQAA